ncbi:MAG: ABC transporter ATP-binding protein [archaeon]|nr:ABC transporter ATP-binding protein [archaeon]MDA1168126.1 ABC transporter ATP-binding protein [archaeon]
MSSDGSLRRLLTYMRPHRSTIRLATFCSVMNKFWDLAPPLLIGVAVDVVVKKEDSFMASFGWTDPWTQLLILGVLTFIIWSLESIFEYIFGLLWRNLAQTVQHDLRNDVFSHVQRQSLSWFDDQEKGNLLAILNDDINQLERFLDKGANDLIQVTTTVIVVGAVFFTLSWQVAIFAIVPIPFILLGSFRYQKNLEPRYKKVRDAAGSLNALLENDLSGMTTIQAFTAEQYEQERVREKSEEYRSANKDAIRFSAAFTPLIRMLILVGFTATLLLGGWLTLQNRMEVGEYSVLVFMTQRLLWPLTRLGETFDLYQRAMASSSRILNLLAAPIALEEGDFAPQRDVAKEGDILFQSVGFQYPGRDPLFAGLDLTVEAGKTLGVVGITGAGKTTLVRLILRFAQPNQGSILWCDQSLSNWSLQSLRQNIALVEQHVTLFPATIEENIRYGKLDASFEEIQHAAGVAEAIEFIEGLPQGWQTFVGEGGHRLSGGQRQRIAIARAVLKDAPLLILDEATSAVDNETEAALQRSLATISTGRTTVIIAHRLSTIRHADRIIVLDQGIVVEDGTHDDLVHLGGHYATLWKVQTGER